MEAIFALVIVGIAMLIPVAIVGLALYIGYRARANRDEAWRNTASRLGLQFVPGRIWGTLNGQSVQCGIEIRGGGKNQETWTVVWGFVQPKLDLGVAVHRENTIIDALASLFGAQDIEIGDPSFDRAFVIKGDEPSRVAELLRPDLRMFLIRAKEQQLDVQLTDLGMMVQTRGAITSQPWIESVLSMMAHAAALVSAAREQVPISSALAPHYEVWSSFARAHGLQGMTTPFAMWGDLDGSKVTVSALRTGQCQYKAQVLVHYPTPLQLGLRVRPGGTLDAVFTFLGGQDHKIGDPAFDAAFVVKANTTTQLRQIFDMTVRQTMLNIVQRVGPVEVRDDGVAVTTEGFPRDPAVIPQLVDVIKGVAQAVHANAGQIVPVHIGPYR
jgi:hypothetical protein